MANIGLAGLASFARCHSALSFVLDLIMQPVFCDSAELAIFNF